ncbi:sensor histidine kinase [Methylobacterium dankookense]|uniref:histidine kinase n=1 Tax=Methylobacterium dankookense TaxID=560405 RepID=A0A564FZD5_9HYPH|nr:sensor histidine kinase [Methylobacterium dankookense]GJD57316.1 Adaptive-response sensory-kinase SasA [Methylobacterium dankookense]VUF13224.1 Sensor protein PhoQ [Methylobacterium dankookense]
MTAPRPALRRRFLGPPGSLQRRLLLAAGAFLGIALVAAGLSIGFILHRFVRGQVDGRLDDRILSLVSDLRPAPGGGLSLGRDRDGPPFDRPRSGWYWQIRRGEARLGSAALEGRDLAVPEIAGRRRKSEEPVPADGVGPWGESLILRVLTLPGKGDAAPTVLVASAPTAALRGPVLEALRTLAACLGVIGLFLFAGVLVQIRLGLRPLLRLRDQLAAVRTGGLHRLPERQPAEVRPLVAEMNALLDQNAANLDHARAHVANLAHGLKTPLATLSLALADAPSDRDGALARLVEGMDRRIRHHLRRARAAAVGGPVRARAELAAHVADLCLVLGRLHAGKDIAFAADVPGDLALACDPQDLDEMLGNLIENACQWCRGRVRIAARRLGTEVVVRIEDDGPGLPDGVRDAILQRGRRLDESQPGHGFGLPIALELAAFYGGSLVLDTSDLGGLAVRVTLPA